MFGKIKATKEAILNMLHVKKTIDEQVRKQLRIHDVEKNVRCNTTMGVSETLYDNMELIVSLTTYSRRIHQAHLVIESLLEQTLKPNRVILWLDRDEFSLENIPIKLIELCKRGLQIEFCENLRSYKKLIPSLRRYPDSAVITADDDILYPDDFVERLYKAYKKSPDRIYFYRGHKMLIQRGILRPYNEWEFEAELNEASLLAFPTGGGGALYTTDLLDHEVANSEVFMSLAPTADDVWFKAMSLKRGILCEQVKIECPFREKFQFLDAMDDMALAKTNLMQGKNDEQIEAVFRRYDLYKLFA